MSRRVSVLSQHLLEQGASGGAPAGEVELQPLSGRAAASSEASTSYASATGRPSSYARVHGSASRAPARWRRIDTVAKEQMREVRYEKAQGEGIAKVGRGAGGRPAADRRCFCCILRYARKRLSLSLSPASCTADHHQPA